MAVNNRNFGVGGNEQGWPIANYAQSERNFQNQDGPMSIPRFKFTYLVEFKVNERVFENPVSNLKEFLCNGKIYTQLKRIDHPKPEVKYETLRSYNKWIKIPTIIEFQGGSMTFDDDSTSVTQALWKEYMNFYSHLATVGENIGANTASNLSSSSASGDYQFTERLTGEEMRSSMSRRPSLGMKLKPNDMRHFFESIVIYDLGTEPDAINVYWFHNPVITVWDHENLDEEDRTGKVEVTANFEYESYYWTFGQNRGRLRDYISTILGFFPMDGAEVTRKSGIGRQIIARNQNQATTTLDSLASVFAANPSLGDLVSNIPDEIKQAQTVNDSVRFPTDEEKEEQALEDSGVQTFGLGEAIQLEPILISAPEPTVPSTIAGKEAELRRVEAEQERLIAAGPIDPTTPEGSVILRKQAKLQEKKEQLTESLAGQRSQQRRNDTGNASTQSALANTQSKLGGVPTMPSGVIPNPRNAALAQQNMTNLERANANIAQANQMIGANLDQQAAILAENGQNVNDPRIQELQGEQQALEAALNSFIRQRNDVLNDVDEGES